MKPPSHIAIYLNNLLMTASYGIKTSFSYISSISCSTITFNWPDMAWSSLESVLHQLKESLGKSESGTDPTGLEQWTSSGRFHEQDTWVKCWCFPAVVAEDSCLRCSWQTRLEESNMWYWDYLGLRVSADKRQEVQTAVIWLFMWLSEYL